MPLKKLFILQSPFQNRFNKQLQLFRRSNFSSSSDTKSKAVNLKKKVISVPCPWGQISGVWWGSEDVQPILAIHGWLDNSGSWKKLAERVVNDEISLLALDLPGTGQSSHLPPFYNYHFSGSASVLRRVQKHFNFKDLILFAHSGGSASAFLFSALYSDVVKAYLAVDYLFYSYKNNEVRASATGEVLDEFLDLTLKPVSTKKYSWNEAKDIWTRGSLLGSTNPELVEDLMERGLIQHGDEYSFSRDLRLKHLKATAVDCFSTEQASALASSISCHICVIKALQSPFFTMGVRNLPSICEILKKSSKSFQLHEIEGHHHIHMEHPDKIGDIATSFINSIK